MVTTSLGFLRSSVSCLSLRKLISIFFLFASLGLSGTSDCQSQGLTPAEKQAIGQIAQGNSGDFSDHTPVVSDAFVEKLLSGGFKAADPSHNMDVQGIVISNAVFEEQINIHFEVPYRVTFDHCRFHQGLDFSGSQFDKDVVFDTPVFGTQASYPLKDSDQDSPPVVQFINATVNGTVSIENGTFHVPADFTSAHVKKLQIENTVFESGDPDNADLDLTTVTVDYDLALSVQTDQPRKVDAQLLSVGRVASLGRQGAGFFGSKEFYLPDTHFQKLTVYEFEQWQANPVAAVVTLDGFSFQELNLYGAGAKRLKSSRLLDLLNSPQVLYSPQPYVALEQHLSTTGDQDGADQTYISMRRHQRGHMSWLASVADWFLDWVIGYGRHPGRALWWTLAFVALGMLIFSPRHMVPQTSEHDTTKNATFSRFWYSLDVLAPAIELGADSAWQPDPNWWFGRNYSYVHRILGWILVPLILAALTGVIH